ncbi:MAG: EthD domain-containing protein [Acidimicrobiales bacterium]
MLELVALGTDVEGAVAVAAELGGTCYVNHSGESERRPFSTLLRIDTDEIERVRAVADVALHVCHRRVIRPEPEPRPSDRVVAVFGLVHHPDLDHRRADDHWRDVHAPLALVNHAAMCDYTQLSVVATLDGPPLDGLALCAFADRDELRTRFFNDEAAKAVIEADVATFADPARSPRRVVMVTVV